MLSPKSQIIYNVFSPEIKIMPIDFYLDFFLV